MIIVKNLKIGELRSFNINKWCWKYWVAYWKKYKPDAYLNIIC